MEWYETQWLLWQSLCDHEKKNIYIWTWFEKDKLSLKNSHTSVVCGQKWPPLKIRTNTKIQIIFCVYNIQIIHDAEKKAQQWRGDTLKYQECKIDTLHVLCNKMSLCSGLTVVKWMQNLTFQTNIKKKHKIKNLNLHKKLSLRMS